MFNMEKIGAFIAGKRKECGLTQGQFAEKLNVTHQAVSKWERGEAMPEISKIGEVAKMLGVSADEMLSQIPEATPKSEVFEYTEADNKYFEFGEKPSINDVYELAPNMSSAVLTKAVSKLLDENGSFAVTLFLPLLDKKSTITICEKVYNTNGINAILSFGKYLPSEYVDKLIIKEYGQGNLEGIKLLPFTTNEVIINAVFDAEVSKVDTWNTLINVVSALPQNVLVYQGVKFARTHNLASFNTWWGRFGRDTSALIMAGYAKECGYSQDAWRQVSYCYNNANLDIIEKAVQESIEQNGKDSVSPLQNVRRQNHLEHNFNSLFDKAFEKANDGLKKLSFSINKNKTSSEANEISDILKEYTEELIEQINSLEDKINDLEGHIDDLEGQIDDLESRIDDLE